MTESLAADTLKKLVWFITGLAILGTIFAIVLYFAVDLPAQLALIHAPQSNPVDMVEMR